MKPAALIEDRERVESPLVVRLDDAMCIAVGEGHIVRRAPKVQTDQRIAVGEWSYWLDLAGTLIPLAQTAERFSVRRKMAMVDDTRVLVLTEVWVAGSRADLPLHVSERLVPIS